MTHKHTPAPWYRNINSKYPIYAERTAGKKDWLYIANIIQGERAGTSEAEQEANLRLITAAPELLEALELISQYYTRLESEGDSYELRMRKCEAWGAVKDSIKKARGE